MTRTIWQPATGGLFNESLGICESVDVACDNRLRGDQTAGRPDQAVQTENEKDKQTGPRSVAVAVNHHGDNQQRANKQAACRAQDRRLQIAEEVSPGLDMSILIDEVSKAPLHQPFGGPKLDQRQ